MQEQTKPAYLLFNRKEDLHCVIYHLAVVACYVTAFWIYLHPERAQIDGPGEMTAFVLGAAWLLGWISGVDVGVNFHNHVHRPVFRSDFLNRWFGRLWTFTGGWPSFFWYHQHKNIHHHMLLNHRDWTLPRRRADGSFENIHKYVLLHFPWRYAVDLWEDFVRGRAGKEIGRTALKEFLIFLPLYSIPFWIDPFMGLCLWVFPHWIGSAITMGSGMYAQHAGSVEKDPLHPVSHSNTYLSPFFNLTMFNIGYHIEHHDNGGIQLGRPACASRGDSRGADRPGRAHPALRLLPGSAPPVPQGGRGGGHRGVHGGPASRLRGGCESTAGCPAGRRRGLAQGKKPFLLASLRGRYSSMT